MTLEETLTTILNVVAFKSDTDGSNISILGKAKEDLSTFLTDHTSISDDEKAKRISDFFTNTIISVTTQAIQVAGQAPLQEAQIATEAQKVASMQLQDTNATNESVQKVISMQNDDKAKLNNSAVNVAKAKAEIETLIPAQVAEIVKSTELKEAQIKTETKRLNVIDKDILIKEKEVLLKEQELKTNEKKLDLLEEQIKQAEVNQLLDMQRISTETQRIALLQAQTGAVGESLRTNREIEKQHDETRLKIATMQLTAI